MHSELRCRIHVVISLVVVVWVCIGVVFDTVFCVISKLVVVLLLRQPASKERLVHAVAVDDHGGRAMTWISADRIDVDRLSIAARLAAESESAARVAVHRRRHPRHGDGMGGTLGDV